MKLDKIMKNLNDLFLNKTDLIDSMILFQQFFFVQFLEPFARTLRANGQYQIIPALLCPVLFLLWLAVSAQTTFGPCHVI